MKTIIISSDWHLDAVTAGVERFNDLTESLNQMLGSILADKVDLFIFAGDLTDPDNSRCWRAVEYAAHFASTLSDHSIASIWLTGNHDCMDDGRGSHTLMPMRPMIRCKACSSTTPHYVCDRIKRLVWNGIEVVCLPYFTPFNQYSIDEISDANPDIVVGHLMLEGISVGSETTDFARGRDIFFPIAEIKRKWPNAIMVNGHYHTAGTYQGVQIPGSIGCLTRGEINNNPGYLRIELP